MRKSIHQIFNPGLPIIVNKLFEDKKKLNRFLLISIFMRLAFFISDGHNSDFDFFEFWADRIVNSGFTNIYAIQVDRFECDYPPLYLYIIAFWGYLFNLFNLDIHTHLFDTFLKLSTLIFELIFLQSFYRKTGNKIFIFLLLISPVTILNAYGWGQIDLLYSVLLFLTIYFITEKRLYLSAIFLGLSLALKTQTLLFIPIIGLLFLLSENSLKEKLFSLLLFIFIFIIPNLPFILFAPDSMDSIRPHISAAGRYNNITVNAFNIYWAFFADYSLKLKLRFPPNDLLVLGLISRKILAYGIFSVIYLYTLFMIYKNRLDKIKLFSLITFFCFSYFMFLPEMHERYLFPFFIFSAYLTSLVSNEWKYFLILSLLHSLNLIWGWGEQKYVSQQWIFESTRAIAFATFVTWCFYAKETYKRLSKGN